MSVRIGLVGAGPWANMLHAPMLARSPDVDLVGIWARRPEAAQALAERRRTSTFASFEEMLDEVDAVAFAVPPDVQAQMAPLAARRGKHLLLEKPLGLDLQQARQVAEAVEAAGVRSQMVLTRRYMPSVRRFLDEASAFETLGARIASLSGATLDDGPFATPWRLTHGALLDLGPHVFDLLEAAAGPIVDVAGRGRATGFSAYLCTHESGAVSQVGLSISQRMETSVWTFELYGPTGVLSLEEGPDAAEDYAAAVRAIPAEFAEAIRQGTEHPLSARRGLRIQEILEQANAGLAR